MSGAVILAIVLAVVIVVAVAALIAHGRRDGGRDLRRRFGPEYDRLAQQRGDPKAVEQELAERVREHDSLTLRPLDPDEREHLVQAWTGVQVRFVDDPSGAARQADQVVTGLLTAIGYPAEDRDRQLALASVDHAYALNDYWLARELAERSTAGSGHDSRARTAERDYGGDGDGDGSEATVADPTEALRQAILHYRVMFNDLLDTVPSTDRAHASR
jgi:hypothetical protein